MSIVSRRVGLIKSLAKENQTLLEKFVAWVRNIIDKINDLVMVNATAVDFNKAQLKAFQDGFLKLVGDLVNNDGKRIFIVRANGDIVLAGNGYKVEDLYELEPQITFSVKNSIDNNAKADNNVLESINENSKKSLNNKEKDMIFNSVKDRTVSEIKRMQKIFKNNEKVKTLLNEEKSIAREHVVQQFLHLYNMFHSPKVNKKSLVERYCGEESCKNKTREEIENKFEEIKTKVKDVLDYARFTYKQTVKMAGNGRGHDGVCNEYSSWTEMERVSQHVERRENEGIGTSSTGNEKNIKGIRPLNHSENQGGFSMPEDKTKYSINDSFKFANNKFLKSLGLKSEENVNVMKKESDKNDVNVARRFLNSFRRTTEKYPKLKPFFRVARKAQEVQENLRWIGYNKMESFSKDLLNKEK